MTAAGVVTVAALGGSAWLITCQGDKGATSGIVAAVEPSQLDASVAAEAKPGVIVRTTDVLAPVVREEPPSVALRQRTPEPRRAAALDARAAMRPARGPDSRPAQTLPQRIGRFIAGDGKHEVRPFPTVPEERP